MNKKIAAYVAEYSDLIITVAPTGFSLLAFLLFFVDMKKKKITNQSYYSFCKWSSENVPRITPQVGYILQRCYGD